MPSDDWLTDLDDPDLDLDDLIEQVTVDAYGNEGYWSFRQAFEDHIEFPVDATVIGTRATITEIDFDGDERRGLVAKVTRDVRVRNVSLLDVEVPAAHGRFARLTRAYRRWLGLDR
jgi:hypothetical protein